MNGFGGNHTEGDYTESENIKYCWDEFRDYAESNGISLDQFEDYEIWWNIWTAAIDAKLLYGKMDAHEVIRSTSKELREPE